MPISCPQLVVYMVFMIYLTEQVVDLYYSNVLTIHLR